MNSSWRVYLDFQNSFTARRVYYHEFKATPPGCLLIKLPLNLRLKHPKIPLPRLADKQNFSANLFDVFYCVVKFRVAN